MSALILWWVGSGFSEGGAACYFMILDLGSLRFYGVGEIDE